MSYIEELKEAIRHLYHAEAIYVETVPVKEVFQDQVVWEGEVEVFDLTDSHRCFQGLRVGARTDIADEPRAHSNSLTYPARYIARESG